MDWNPTLLNTNVANLRPPACDQPLYSNGGRVAHRTDNSDMALPEQRRKAAAGSEEQARICSKDRSFSTLFCRAQPWPPR